jgi:transcriptional regulator with XRE-family HTH domain
MQLSATTAPQWTGMNAPSPLVQRRRLRTELRRARGGAGMTQGEVARAMDWSLSKVIRIETGAVGVSTNDLRALLSLYEIDDQDRIGELVELARASRQSSTWNTYRGDISPQFLQFLEYEEAASVLRSYEPLLIPGLLQAEEYAATIIQGLPDPGTPPELIRKRLEIRQIRQRLLEQEAPSTFSFVMDESAIQRLFGQQNIAQGQIARLIELANRPGITVEVVPFSAGLHRGMLEPFQILEFSDPEDSDILFVESSRDMILSHDEAGEIAGYREVFEELRSISLGPDGTLTYLANLLKQMS